LSNKNNGPLNNNKKSLFAKIGLEWKIFVIGLIKPLVLIPLGFFILFLYFANRTNVDRVFSIVLQVLAAFFATTASKFLLDFIKGNMEGSILMKKGHSAVRNLSLTRFKAKNISDRAKANVSTEEIINLLSLLEKDIANAIQEWNDIIPGVDKIEEIYVLLDEKEREKELINNEKVELEKKLKEHIELSDKDKETLKNKLYEKDMELLKLSNEVNKLRFNTTVVSSGSFPSSLQTPITFSPFEKICLKCGKSYKTDSLFDIGFCDDCKGKL